MKSVFRAAMCQATKLAGARNVAEATRVIQRALSGISQSITPGEQPNVKPRLIELTGTLAEPPLDVEKSRQDATTTGAGARDAAVERIAAPRLKRPLGDVLNLLRQGELPGFDGDWRVRSRKAPPVPVPDGATYLSQTFTCESGSRDYKVYIPSHKTRRNPPLLIMLHGCTQNPDDFAAGTGMNQLAEDYGFIVAYPGQSMSAHQTACWNWFQTGNQMRGQGEPAILAGITQTITAASGADPGMVYVAGLSAGGAMAAILGATYPEVYAAIGIHSGLAYGSATDMASAFAAMRGASGPAAPPRTKSRPGNAAGFVRTIVFHGTSDQTVHPSNAGTILAEARAGLTGPAHELRHASTAGNRAYTRTVIEDARGVPQVEHWAVEGLGHAWSGGRAEGSYTDQHGPDASRELLRFFLESDVPPPDHRRLKR